VHLVPIQCGYGLQCTSSLCNISPIGVLLDEDITLTDTTIDYKVSSFLYLHNEKIKNCLLPNTGISNVLRNNGDGDRE
jgi:hypothetical protein